MAHVMLWCLTPRKIVTTMKITTYFVASAIIGTLGMMNQVKAQDSTTTTPTTTTAPPPPPPTVMRDDRNDRDNRDMDDSPLYRSQELDLDLFGSGSLGQDTLEHISGSRFRHHSLWGGGGGATFFFCRYVGVGGEFDAEDRTDHFFDSADGNIFLRVPILETGLAPYIFGGGGYQFEDFRQSFGQAGGGLEFRFCRHFGIFVDGRYVFAEQSENYAEARAGFRLAF